ncbi:MarR family winged helix-turn-helix transcriptional regulator [Catenuloplanes atrovinosus]|uniref:DNA-binding MarR family transcriptional regulator n=1 Tax=Catenuloplanes atrovinosus TaxID=137266 RepID=A0AAE4C8F3_9ACTN|nr:MarR family transcriptional regulator [Catenuloplanes atrovinosus]MDR7273734.1 DNA-binding MarR family transcriptional regulator [Catenuloplanes atrovinosus]
MTDAQDRIERELTLLVRRTQRIHLRLPGVVRHVERSAYSILGRLHDDGPARLTTLATLFTLDVSTVSRQVQALRTEGLISRSADPGDRRATLISITEHGTEVLLGMRAARRALLRELTGEWPAVDRERFAELLERFNDGVADRLGGAPESLPQKGLIRE